MESSVKQCPECEIVYIRLAGSFAGEELLGVLSDIEDTDSSPEARTEVWDLRAVRGLYLSDADLDELQGHLPEWKDAPSGEAPVGRTVVMARTTSQKAYGTVMCRSLRPYAASHRPSFSAKRAARWAGCLCSTGRDDVDTGGVDDSDAPCGGCPLRKMHL